MKPLFTVEEIAAITGGRLVQGEGSLPITGFAWDSRLVKPGDCFVAMPGERVDGHRYTAQAAAAGAACILASREVEAPGAALVLVPDSLLALGQLGRAHRDRFATLAVGITGSVGKTTTKEMVAAVLGQQFQVFRSHGNMNSAVGMPITLMDLSQSDEVAVLEMGMQALGEIDYLVSIARPKMGIVTNVGITHIELLGTQANIARAKGELVRSLPADGYAVLNADDPWVRGMAAETEAQVWYYGFEAQGVGDRWVTITDVAREGEVGQSFRLITSQGEVEGHLPALGRHNLLNAMAAAAAGLALGMDLATVVRGIAQFQGSRMQIRDLGGVRLLDDTYNAAPVSMIASLGVMRDLAGPQGRCIAVLADMFELGELAEEGHRQVGAEAARLADQVVAVGDLARFIADAAGAKGSYFETKAPAIAALKERVRPGDTVLVKGSRGMAMEEIVTALAEHLSAKM